MSEDKLPKPTAQTNDSIADILSKGIEAVSDMNKRSHELDKLQIEKDSEIELKRIELESKELHFHDKRFSKVLFVLSLIALLLIGLGISQVFMNNEKVGLLIISHVIFGLVSMIAGMNISKTKKKKVESDTEE